MTVTGIKNKSDNLENQKEWKCFAYPWITRFKPIPPRKNHNRVTYKNKKMTPHFDAIRVALHEAIPVHPFVYNAVKKSQGDKR